MRSIVRIVACAAALAALAEAGPAAAAPPGLDMGPHAVGFRSFERYDLTRVFREKLGPAGTPRPGERARPVYIYLWYPAEAAESDPRMVYGEYSFASPADPAFYSLAARLQEREIYGALYPFFGGNRGSVVDLMNAETRAVLDAKALEGTYPVVLYHTDLRGSSGENVLLCEYLASHGYVVAAAHSIGTLLRDPAAAPDDIESLVRDKEFVFAELREWPQCDLSKLGLVGRGIGGITSILQAMRGSDVDAVVTLGEWIPAPGRTDPFSPCAGWRPERMTAPVLALRADGRNAASARIDSLVHSTRFLATLTGAQIRDFAGYAALVATTPLAPENASDDSYSRMCDMVRRFLDGHLRGALEEIAVLEEAAGGALLPSVKEIRIARGVPAAMREDQIQAVFWEEGSAAGIELLRELRAAGAERPLPPATLNTLGYTFLAAQRLEEAIEIFRAGADLYPGSANSWASLGEACMYAGRADDARGCFKKTLELLSVDTDLDEGTRAALKQQAEETLKRLGE